MSADPPTSEETPRVLVAVPRGPMRDRLVALLAKQDVNVDSVGGATKLGESVDGADADLVILRREDLGAQHHRLLEAMASDDSAPEIVVVGPGMDDASRVDLVAAGAADVIDATELDVRAAESIAAMASGSSAYAGSGLQEPALSDFASRSKSMHVLLDLVHQVGPTDCALLVTGETGVGKEHLARAIHAASPRSGRPFVAVNCGALPEQLLESELFGHAEGAFTGAAQSRKGLFQTADGGSLLLDEVGEMPLHLQVKLLRVLQRGDVRPLGSDESVRVDVRVIAATNRDLPALVEERAFREDLYFRLNVVELTLPPLRERLDDLPTIIGSLLRQSWAASGRPGVRGLEDAALDALLRYDWPGNVRELINVLERAVLVCRGESITIRDLPAQILEPGQGGGGGALFDGGLPPSLLEGSWKDARAAVLRAAERAYLVEALTRCRGVMADTARHAGLSTRSLYDKMRAHGLRRQDFT